MILTDRKEQLRIRVHGPDSAPTLIYLPGLHGDWTLTSNFRRALADRIRFIEVAYPETPVWSLEDHAAAVEAMLRQSGVSKGWILGESFGSQVAWPMLARGQFEIEGIILAGGFVRHPARWAAKLGSVYGGCISMRLIRGLLQGYAKLARWRFHRDGETAAAIRDYVDRLTERTRRAAMHRLRLVAESDFSEAARQRDVPLFALTGFWDPIVPCLWVRSLLKRGCPSLREYKVVWGADHNVLGTAPTQAAELVLKWMEAG